MAGLDGLVRGFRADANKRIHKFTAVVKSTANTSSQQQQFAAIPAAANALGVLGVLTEHFVEPNFFVTQGTDPTTVTGTTPVLYNLQNRGMSLQVNGIARCIAGAVPINQGDELNIADAFGRVKTVNEAAGTQVQVIGIAQHQVTNLNDVVRVLLNFYQKKT